MRATMYGCEIVCPQPIGSATSSYAYARSPGGTNSSRGTRPIAASTRSSSMPRARSWRSTISRRRASGGGEGSRMRPEVRQDERRDADDAFGGRREPDREHRDERVAGRERAVAAAADVVPAAQVDELPPGRRRDEHVARVRVPQRGPCPLEPGRVAEDARVAARPARPEPQLLSLAARDPVAVLEEEHHLRSRLVVQPLRELADILRAARQPVDLPRAVRRGNGDVRPGEAAATEEREIGVRALERDRALDLRLAVVGADDDGVAVEERVDAPGS